MNERQKKLLIAIALVVLGMLIFPPWQLKWTEGRVLGKGYGWLFDPPHHLATVDIGLLITQWIAVLIIGGIAYFILKDR